MQHAFDAAFGSIELTGRKLELFMGALVFQRIQLAVVVEDHDGRASDLVEHGFQLAGEQLACGAYERPGLAHAAAPVSGFSRISKRRSARLGMP